MYRFVSKQVKRIYSIFRHDFLYVWDKPIKPDFGPKIALGDDEKPPGILALTGNNLPDKFISKGPNVALTFITDHLVTKKGFKIYFEKGMIHNH